MLVVLFLVMPRSMLISRLIIIPIDMKSLDEVPQSAHLTICPAGKPHKEQNMHCRFAKDILSYIPPVESHTLIHDQTPTRRLEHKNWLTVDWKYKHIAHSPRHY